MTRAEKFREVNEAMDELLKEFETYLFIENVQEVVSDVNRVTKENKSKAVIELK